MEKEPEEIRDALWRALKEENCVATTWGNLGAVLPATLAFSRAPIHPLAQIRHAHHSKLLSPSLHNKLSEGE